MAIEIVSIRPWFSMTFRIRKHAYQTDPTNNAVYSRVLVQQGSFLENLFNEGEEASDSPYYSDIMTLNLILSDYIASADLKTFLPCEFAGAVGGIPNINLSVYCSLPVYQSKLVDNSSSNSDYPRSETAQNAGMSIEYILSRYASGTALPVQTRNMMSDSKRGLTVGEMKNIRVIDSEMDAQSYINDVNNRKAAAEEAAANKPPESD